MATTTRTPNNIYIMNEIGKENGCLDKEDEIWIWKKILGHIKFDNLVNFDKNQAVK